MDVQQCLANYRKWMLEDRLRHATMVFCGYAKDVLQLIEQWLTYSFEKEQQTIWLDAFQLLRKKVQQLDQVADYDDEKYIQLLRQLRAEGASLAVVNNIQREHQRFLYVMRKNELSSLREPLRRIAKLAEQPFSEQAYKQQIAYYSAKPIQLIDQFDYFAESLRKTTIRQEIEEQLQLIISQLVDQLAYFGIVEIEALGQRLDGEKMISIGSLRASDAQTIDKYHVCKVYERGYYIEETEHILREAKVMTVM